MARLLRDPAPDQAALDLAVAAALRAPDHGTLRPARFVFVAMGPPQSEKFCQRLIDDGRATGLGLCIGSSITTLTGRTPSAPRWMEDRGLVWLYRLAREPGKRESRYMHLFSGEVETIAAVVEAAAPATDETLLARVEALENEVEELKQRLDSLLAHLGD